MTITRPKIKPCGPHCHCRSCNEEWAQYWSEQREIDETVHRDRLVRECRPATDREWEEHLQSCGYGEPGDLETMWIGGAS